MCTWAMSFVLLNIILFFFFFFIESNFGWQGNYSLRSRKWLIPLENYKTFSILFLLPSPFSKLPKISVIPGAPNHPLLCWVPTLTFWECHPHLPPFLEPQPYTLPSDCLHPAPLKTPSALQAAALAHFSASFLCLVVRNLVHSASCLYCSSFYLESSSIWLFAGCVWWCAVWCDSFFLFLFPSSGGFQLLLSWCCSS